MNLIEINRCEEKIIVNQYQDLKLFKLPKGFRGRSALYVQLWWLVQATLFRWSPQIMYGFRVWILKIFGAQVGVGVEIRPTVTITYPWKVSIGNYVRVGDDVVIYSLGEIKIGENSVISQRAYLCAGDHDYTDNAFPIRSRPISIEEECWIATDVFLSPGITIGRGAVIGARSTVLESMPSGMVCVGIPCKPIKSRK